MVVAALSIVSGLVVAARMHETHDTRTQHPALVPQLRQ